MELWIRSQDKLKLVNDCVLVISDAIKDEYIIEDVKNKYLKLATYKTKERALEVLDEIEERIMMLNTTNLICDNVSLVGFEKALGEEKSKGLCFPYQMPEE